MLFGKSNPPPRTIVIGILCFRLFLCTMSGVVSSAAKRPRISWSLRIKRFNNSNLELEIMYKNTRNEQRPFSKSSSDILKSLFGSPIKCELIQKKIAGEETTLFKFTNKRREAHSFTVNLFNSFSIGESVTDFSRRITNMIVSGRLNVLALYLSILPYSTGFVHHRAESHTNDGLCVDGSGIQEKDILVVGGNLDELRDLISVARLSCVEVLKETKSSSISISKYFTSSTEKIDEPPLKKTRISKTETMKNNEFREIVDKTGLEQTYLNSFVGNAEIPLENIEVAPDLVDQVCPFRVQSIVDSMKKYDPSQAVLVVCPVDLDRFCDLKNVKDQKFYCIQKIHTLAAFKQLEKDDLFRKLVTHTNKTVCCFVVKTDSPELWFFGNLRATSTESQFVRKIHPQRLIHVYYKLASAGIVNARKVIDRMCKLFLIGPNEATSVSKLVKWSLDAVAVLSETFHAYESYLTLDVKPSGHQSRLSRGQKLPVTNILFNKLAKIDEQYFRDGYKKVLDREISLKCLIEEYEEVSGVRKVITLLSVIAGHRNYEAINYENPGKFDFETLKLFIGAEMSVGGIKNSTAERLEQYYKSVLDGQDIDAKSLIKFHEFSGFEVMFQSEIKFDTHIVVMSSENKDFCVKLSNYAVSADAKNMKFVIIFPTGEIQSQFLSHIRSRLADKVTHAVVKPLLFGCESKVVNHFAENVRFGVFFGNIANIRSGIKVYHEQIDGLADVIDKVVNPNSRILYLSEKLPLVQVHNSSLHRVVEYYGPKSEIDKLKLKSTKNSPGPDMKKTVPDRAVLGCITPKVTNRCEVDSQHKESGVISDLDVSLSSDDSGYLGSLPIRSPLLVTPVTGKENRSRTEWKDTQVITHERKLAAFNFSAQLDKLAEEAELD